MKRKLMSMPGMDLTALTLIMVFCGSMRDETFDLLDCKLVSHCLSLS